MPSLRSWMHGGLVGLALLGCADEGRRVKYPTAPPINHTLPWGTNGPAAVPPAPATMSPAPAAFPWSVATACTSDAQCLLHRCNTAASRCAFPCTGAQDCAAGTTCLLGVCAGIPWPATTPAPTPTAPVPAPPPVTSGDYDYRTAIALSRVAASAFGGDDFGSAYLRDVMGHTTDRWGPQDGPTTMGHETLHGLQGDLRNATPARDAFTYLEGGIGAYTLEPAMNLAVVKDYVHPTVRSIAADRYQLYLVDQLRYWSETLYLFEEWSAYIATGRIGVEVVRAGRWDGPRQDAVDGMMEFLCFGSAAALALRDREPTYFAGNAQFKAVFAYLVETTMRWFAQGIALPHFQGFEGQRLHRWYVESPENENVRSLLRGWYGTGWTRRVLGLP